MPETELIKITEGQYCAVYWTVAVRDELEKLSKNKNKRKFLSRCERHMELLSSHGPKDLNAEKFKNEGQFTLQRHSKKQIAVYAFKAYQLRIYGGFVAGRFICTEVDLAKKQNKADRGKLRSAADKLGEFLELGS